MTKTWRMGGSPVVDPGALVLPVADAAVDDVAEVPVGLDEQAAASRTTTPSTGMITGRRHRCRGPPAGPGTRMTMGRVLADGGSALVEIREGTPTGARAPAGRPMAGTLGLVHRADGGIT
jgi:hypothetical protein